MIFICEVSIFVDYADNINYFYHLDLIFGFYNADYLTIYNNDYRINKFYTLNILRIFIYIEIKKYIFEFFNENI